MTNERKQELEKLVYIYNLSTTNTIKSINELPSNDTIIDIDYSNSIKFMDLIEIFNNSYLKFLRDYNHIPKIKLSKEHVITSYSKRDDDELNIYQLLIIYLYGVNEGIYCEDDWIALYLTSNQDKTKAYLSNECYNPYEKKRYVEQINIKEKIIRNYLDIADKHQDLVNAFITLRDCFIFGNGFNILISKIDGELLDNIKTFTLTFGNCYWQSSDFIQVKFQLGDKIKIIEKKIILNNQELNNEEEINEILEYLLNNLYINNEKLPKLYSVIKSNELNSNIHKVLKKD